MPAPTKNDWNSFHVESFENKVNVLFYYLCQRGYNMQEIAENILHDYNPHRAQRVSCITRCYGFGGRNGGVFSNIGATREDIAAFVRAYPNGCDYDGNGQTIRAFLLNRVRSGNSFQSIEVPVDDTEYMQDYDYERLRRGMINLIVYIIIIIAVFCICIFVLHWNWIVSVIAAVACAELVRRFILVRKR